MRALIVEVPSCPNAALFDVAGRPLLVRQLQWLRDGGITQVVIEVAGSSHPTSLYGWLLGDDPLLDGCTIIPTEHPLGARAVALRAGIPLDEVLVTLPADVLAQGDLPQLVEPGRYVLYAPDGMDAPPVTIAIEALDGPEAPPRLHDGWALRVGSPLAAHTLSCAALMGAAPGVLIHGAEVKPGIWLGRGARIAEDVELRAPLFIGPEARVMSRAQLGPRVTVGRGCVIEREAQLSDCSIAPNTLVGEATRARGAHLSAAHMTSLSDGTLTAIDDPLVLTRVHAPARVRLASRLLAIVLIAPLLLPWLLVTLLLLPWRRPVRTVLVRGTPLHVGSLGVPLLDSYPALFDVAIGLRSLVGATEPALLEALPRDLGLPAGAIDILPSLAPSERRDTQLRLLRWYALHKARDLDFALWLRRFH